MPYRLVTRFCIFGFGRHVGDHMVTFSKMQFLHGLAMILPDFAFLVAAVIWGTTW